jgi:hypothetical protein
VSAYPETDPEKLRNMAAILATLSGAAQCLSLWILPVTPVLLLTALTGAFYLFLALGLFGISRFSLLLAISLPLLRSWFGLYPLEIPAWELLRVACDIAIAGLSLPVLWASLEPDHRIVAPGLRKQSADSEPPNA